MLDVVKAPHHFTPRRGGVSAEQLPEAEKGDIERYVGADDKIADRHASNQQTHVG